MKILYHHRVASKDGQYVHIEELTNALKQLGHEIIMVGPSTVEKGSFGSEGGIVPFLKRFVPGFAYELMEFGYALVAYMKLRHAVLKYKPDWFYERYSLYMPAGVWLRKRFNLPMLLEINAPLFEERGKYCGLALPKLAKWTEEYAWRNADIVLPVTAVLAARVHEARVPIERINVIPNGIDSKKFSTVPDTEQAKKRLGLGGGLVLGFTGFMREWHGLDQVVDIVARNRDRKFHLLLVGDGPARGGIEEKARMHGVEDCVTITGVVAREQIADYVAAFDIALQPDVVDYASPLKLFEYLALGRTIVAPARPNIREVLSDGENALLFDPDTPGALMESVERLCGDAALRKKLGEAARSTIQEKGFTWKNNARRVEALFHGLRMK